MGDGRSWGARVAARPHAWAALLLGACVFAYLWPVLVGGKILSPSAALYAFVPWQGYAPPDIGHFVNPILLDLPVVDGPWRVLARRLIHEGTFPAWNPYALGGIPFYSNPQTGIFSPFNLPLWTLPLTYGLGVSAALKLFTGAYGTYLLTRQLRLSLLPGLLAGIAFAFSAINITWLAHETLPGVVVMLPWALWLTERIYERARVADTIALAIVVAIGLSGGHPGMQIHLLLVTATYTLLRAACTRRPAPVPLTRALVLTTAAITTAGLLMAFMLIPEYLATHDTVGVAARTAGQLPGANLPRSALATVAFPDWWGRPSAIEAPPTAANGAILFANFGERTFYAGTVALLLAAMGLVARGGWRRKLPFALVGLVGLAVAVHAPGLNWLATHLPLLDSVEPQRLHFVFEFAVAVLAAFGLQALLDAPAAVGRRLAVVGVALLAALVAATQAGLDGDDVAHVLDHFATGADYVDGGVLALTTVAWFALFALAVGALVLVVRLRPAWRTAAAGALVLLALADALHFVHGYQPMGPASRVVPPVTPAIAFLQQRRDEGRVVGLNGALQPDSGLVYGLRDVRGYDPPQPTSRMLRLWRLVNPAQAGWQPFALTDLGVAQLHVLGVLGARWIVGEPGLRFSRRALPQLTTVYAGPDATVFENAAAVPRAFVPARVRVTPGRRATGEAIVDPRFDPRTDVAVERDQPGAAALAPGHGSVAVVRDENARIALRAQLGRRGLVVLNDQLLAGWSVRVDGRPARALHVNGVMRGVVVPAGEHEVVWSYRVPGLRAGALVSVATLALLVAASVLLGVRSRRRRRAASGRRLAAQPVPF